eukprot:967311-Pleurochrysis_carterae.AAC.1
MQDEKVVDVAADDKALAGLLSAEAPARLGHAVNGLLDATYARTAVGAQGSVPGGCVAIDYLSGLQFAL